MSSGKQLRNIVMKQTKPQVERLIRPTNQDYAFFNPASQQALQEYYPQQPQQSKLISNSNFDMSKSKYSLQQINQNASSLKSISKSCRNDDDDTWASLKLNAQKNNMKLNKILDQTIKTQRITSKQDLMAEDNLYLKKQNKSKLGARQPVNKTVNVIPLRYPSLNVVGQMSAHMDSIVKNQKAEEQKLKYSALAISSDRKNIQDSSIGLLRKNTQQLLFVRKPPLELKSIHASLNKLLQSYKNPTITKILNTSKLQLSQYSNKEKLKTMQQESTVHNPIIKSFLYQTDLPMNHNYVLDNHIDYLNDFERTEITEFNDIFYFGQNAHKLLPNSNQALNFGYDNEGGDYLFTLNDHVAYRYEILGKLGRGSFGQTLLVLDHKRKSKGALKIIRNKKKFHQQALIEIQVLNLIRQKDKNSCSSSLIKIKDYFLFRNHVCILFELMSMNLYEFLRQNKFSGVSVDLIRRFGIQLLQALLFLQQNHIIHCDLKPENILLKETNKSGIKVIDFGSSCFEDERMYTYIQSRFYRAPEIILGMNYGLSIDMWSFGCIITELFIGTPLFPSDNEKDHMSMLFEVIGLPSLNILEQSKKRQVYFDVQDIPIVGLGKIRQVFGKPLPKILHSSSDSFIDFVQQCLTWDPKARLSPAEALVHEWVLEGLPPQIRDQHLQTMKECAPWLQIFKNQQKRKNFLIDNNNSYSLRNLEMSMESPGSKQGVQGEILKKSMQASCLVDNLKQRLNTNVKKRIFN